MDHRKARQNWTKHQSPLLQDTELQTSMSSGTLEIQLENNYHRLQELDLSANNMLLGVSALENVWEEEIRQTLNAESGSKYVLVEIS